MAGLEDIARRVMESTGHPALESEEPDLIDRIEEVRKQNNHQWMALLRLALEAEPEKARAILLQIKQNDSEVQRLLGQLASD